ncbi:unnamed protein product [Amoebophrya sp. A25]|nr:unnamed protein product [Amoebophrya sp. A25]|eukprot:GSA25T00025401001.1
MEYYADSPRFVRKRFHAEQEVLTHIQHSDTCLCLKCTNFAKTIPKLGIQIPKDVLDETARNRVIGYIENSICPPADGPEVTTRGRSARKDSVTSESRKYRDMQWLMTKMRGSVIVGVNTLYKDERGRQSFDIQISTVVDPSGHSRAASGDENAAARKAELAEKMNNMVHRVLIPDMIFFDRGKPTQYFLTCNMDEDVSSAGQSGFESTTKKNSKGKTIAAPVSTEENEKKAKDRKAKRELKKTLDAEVAKVADSNALLTQRTLTALVKLRSSSELITIVRDFLRKSIVLRRKAIAYEKFVAACVREAGMSEEELATAIAQYANPRLEVNPYKYFLVPGKEGEMTQMQGVTVYLPPGSVDGPNGLAMVKAQKPFIRTYTSKRGIVPRQASLQWKPPEGGSSDTKAPGPHALSNAVNPYADSMEMIRIQYKDGSVRLWSDREVRMFCVLRKPNRQEFMDIQSMQILPFAGMHNTNDSLQFVTYNYNEKLVALKAKMRARSPQREKVIYDPVPARPISPKRAVSIPFENKASKNQEEEEPEPVPEVKKKPSKKKPPSADEGANEASKSSKEAPKGASQDAGGNSTKGAAATVPEAPANPLASANLSPDLAMMREYFPDAQVVLAEEYEGGKIYLPGEEVQRIRELQRSLSPERYKTKKKKPKAAVAAAPAAASPSKEKASTSGASPSPPSKSSASGSGGATSSTAVVAASTTEDHTSSPAASKERYIQGGKEQIGGSKPSKTIAPPKVPALNLGSGDNAPPGPEFFERKRGEVIEALGRGPELHYMMTNTDREQIMDETIDKLNAWLEEHFNLRIFAGIFEFAFAKIDVPTVYGLEQQKKRPSQQQTIDPNGPSKKERVKRSPLSVVSELQETRVRGYLMNASKLVVGKSNAKMKQTMGASPATRASSPSPYASDHGAPEDEYVVYDSPDDMSPDHQKSPDSSPGPSETAEDLAERALGKKKRIKWKTQAGPEMLTNMVDMWEPIRLECSTDPLAEFKRSQHGAEANSLDVMVRATVDAAREGTPFEHVAFIAEDPAPCERLETAGNKLGQRVTEANKVLKTRVGPIGALLSKPLTRSMSDAGVSEVQTSRRSRIEKHHASNSSLASGPSPLLPPSSVSLLSRQGTAPGLASKTLMSGPPSLVGSSSRGGPSSGQGMMGHSSGQGMSALMHPGSARSANLAPSSSGMLPQSKGTRLQSAGQRALLPSYGTPASPAKIDVSRNFLGEALAEATTPAPATAGSVRRLASPARTTCDSLADLIASSGAT